MSVLPEGPSPTDSGMADFKECLKHLRDGHLDEALARVRLALETTPTNPFYLSYAGLLVALAEKQFGDAEKLCREALKLRRNHPQLYLNLAEVYYTARRPEEAIEVLERGFTSTGRDRRIRRALENLGRRREPVFSFLHRNNAMNRVLGRWRHRLMGPPRSAN
ncbi:MAG TPA: tetratricopeptide repeat protein [Candidatus Acidoferrum sp.]|nr:tetratricopeptide repeat protein [Candidatus Acidoferrum sp.]